MQGGPDATSKARVLVADGNAGARATLRRAIQPDGFSVCAEAADAASAVTAARLAVPDLALIAVELPGGGIRAAAAISALPGVLVVMMTSSRSDEDLFDALRAGAAGYLFKDIAPARLPAVLRRVLEGEVALPRSLVSRLVIEFQAQSGRRRVALAGRHPARLTGREWEVLELLAHGCTTAEIAQRLFIAQVTVRTHLAAVLKKLQVPDRQAALDLLGTGDPLRKTNAS